MCPQLRRIDIQHHLRYRLSLLRLRPCARFLALIRRGELYMHFLAVCGPIRQLRLPQLKEATKANAAMQATPAKAAGAALAAVSGGAATIATRVEAEAEAEVAAVEVAATKGTTTATIAKEIIRIIGGTSRRQNAAVIVISIGAMTTAKRMASTASGEAAGDQVNDDTLPMNRIRLCQRQGEAAAATVTGIRQQAAFEKSWIDSAPRRRR